MKPRHYYECAKCGYKYAVIYDEKTIRCPNCKSGARRRLCGIDKKTYKYENKWTRTMRGDTRWMEDQQKPY